MHGCNRDVKGIGLGDGRDRALCDERCGQFRYARRGYVEFRHIFDNIKPLTGGKRIAEADLIENELRDV